MTIDLDKFRVGDPDLSHGAEVYEVTEPDELNPDWPVRYRLDVSDPEYPVLTCDQPGPFLIDSGVEETTVELDTLVRLGEIAAALLARRESSGSGAA